LADEERTTWRCPRDGHLLISGIKVKRGAKTYRETQRRQAEKAKTLGGCNQNDVDRFLNSLDITETITVFILTRLGGMRQGGLKMVVDAAGHNCPGIGKPSTVSRDAFAGNERGRLEMVASVSNIARFGLDCINLMLS
jgi:hypothetical protein